MHHCIGFRFSWLSVAMALAMVCAPASAEVIILSNIASAHADVAPGAGGISDDQASPSLPQPQASVTVSANAAWQGCTVGSTGLTQTSANQVVLQPSVQMQLDATCQSQNRQLDASGLLEVKFQLNSTMNVSLGYNYSRVAREVLIDFGIVQLVGGVEQAVPDPGFGQPYQLSPGVYVARAKTTATVQSTSYTGSAVANVAIARDATVLYTFSEASPFARGPNPVSNPSTSTAPFAVASTKIASPSGFGKGTVYYPVGTSEGPFGVVVVTPDFAETQSQVNWVGSQFAAWGFVVVTIDTKTLFDSASSRAAQAQAALNQVTSLGNQASSPLAGLVDGSRRAAIGHGIGSSLELANIAPNLLASIPLAPKVAGKDYSATHAATLILACSNDKVAPSKTNAELAYGSLSKTLPKALATLYAAGHACTNNNSSDLTKSGIVDAGVPWLKRFVDQDLRFAKYLCAGAPYGNGQIGPPNSAFSGAYMSNCPY